MTNSASDFVFYSYDFSEINNGRKESTCQVLHTFIHDYHYVMIQLPNLPRI